VQQQQVYAGSYAARATSSGAAAYAYKTLSTTPTDLYMRARFKILSQGASSVGLLTLRNSSNGDTFCVQAGERLDVYLTGAPGRMWASIQSDSRSVVAVTHGQLTLPVGETGAFFAALHQGIAHLSSARQVCASKPIHCDALIAFRATVIVTGHQ